MLAWGLIVVGGVLLVLVFSQYPFAIWDLDNYAQSPITFAFMADQGMRVATVEAVFGAVSPLLMLIGLLFSSSMISFGLRCFKAENVYATSHGELHRFWRACSDWCVGAGFMHLFPVGLQAQHQPAFVISIIVAVLCGLG